jgi:hypothetical protein
MKLTAKDIHELTRTPVSSIQDAVKRGLVQPVEYGARGRGLAHLFNSQQALAFSVGQVLRGVFRIRGAAVDSVIREIGGMSYRELRDTLKERPVLLVVPGVTAESRLVPADDVDRRAGEILEQHGVLPAGIDVARLWRAMCRTIEQKKREGEHVRV